MKKVLSLFFLIGLSSALYGQDWTSPIAGNRNPNFYSVQQSFNTYWQNKDITVTKGWKAYKRWENFWESRVAKDGTFPAFNVVEKEWNAYLATHTPLAAGGWTSVGPATSSSGYNGIGRINCLAFHPTDVNTIWVGTPAGGLWKTTNGGSSWSNNSDDFPSLGVSAIAIHPTTPTTMYIGTGDGDGYDTYFYGMRKSIDGGTTWTTVAMPGSQPNVARKIIINPTNPSIVIAATDNGLYQSTNDGVSWILATPGNMYDLEFKPGDPSIVYASSRTEIFKSINGGSTWTSVRSITGSNRIALAVSPANPALVVALSSSSADNGFNGVYTSNNSGVSFSTTATTPNLLGWAKDGADTGGQGYYDLDIAISPTDANTIFVGGVNTWKSTNGGTSWTINTFWYSDGSATQAVHADKHFLGYQNGSTTLFQGCDGGIYKTTNGTNWTDLSAGLVISQMYKLGTAQTSDAVMVGLQDNSSKAKLPGLSWVDIASTGDGMEGAIDPTNDKIQYTESYYGNIRRITLNASYQKTAEVSIKPVGQSGAWVTPFVIDPNNASTIYIGFKDIFKSTDKGTTWSLISTNLSTSNMTNIAVAPSNSNYIYVSSGSSMFKTTNGGSSWTSVTQPTGGWISYIMVNPAAPSTVYITLSNAGSGQKVYKSTDGGGTWTNISGTLPNLSVNCITYQKTTNDALYIGTDVGIFYRDGTMNDWITFKAGLPNVIVNELEINYSNNKILAATYGRGLWESNLYSVGPQTCSIPSNLNTSGVLSTEANLSWSGTSIATSYTVQYRAILPATIKRPTTRGKQSDATPIIQNGIIVGYTYPKANTNNPLNGELWTTITVNSNNAVLTGLSPNTQYEFQVKSNCSGEASVFSASANFTTLSGDCAKVPTTYGAYTNTYIGYTSFNWQTQTDVLAYKVEWKRVSDTEWNFDYVSPPYTYYDILLDPAIKYEWRVSSICLNEVESAPSAIKTFTTPAPACLGTASTPILSLNNVWANAASVFWTATYGKGYVFAYRKTTETAWSYRTFARDTYLQLDGLLPSTAYECKIKAVCDGLNEAYSNVVTFTTQADACASRLVPLADYSAINITATSATLKWSAIPGVTSYRLEMYGFPTQTVSGTSYNMTGLTTATWYSFRVSPICATGSPYLYPNTYTFRTTGIDCQAPYPLTGLASSTATTAKVYWGAVGGATGYKVQYRIADPTNYSNSSNAWTTFTTTNTNFEFTGLDPQTSYDYRITTSTDGCWYVYNTVTTTEAAPCDAPTNLYAYTNSLYGYTQLSWKGVAGAVEYTVRYREVTAAAAWKTLKVSATINTPLTHGTRGAAQKAASINTAADDVVDVTTLTYYNIPEGTLISGTDYEFGVETSCGNSTSGFTPWTKFRTPNAPCTDATNIYINTYSNLAYISWAAVYGPGAKVSYKKVSDATWTTISTMYEWVELWSLTPNTDYVASIQIRCPDGSVSPTTVLVPFKTQADNCLRTVIPYDKALVSNVTLNSATISWAAPTGVTTFHAKLYGSDGSFKDYPSVSGTSLNLTGLQANVYYTWYIYPICNGVDGSFIRSWFITGNNPNCYPPNFYVNMPVTSKSAKIKLQIRGGGDKYYVEYKKLDETTWTSVTFPVTEFVELTGLSAETHYDFLVRSGCGAPGTYINSGNFATAEAPPCTIPTNLYASTSSLYGYTSLGWTGNESAIDYTVQYRVVGSAAAWKSAKVAARGVQTPLDPRIANVPLHSFTANVGGDWVTDYTTQTYFSIEKGILDPATDYEFQVEANCQSGLSGFSEIKTFRTPNPACTDIANLRLGGAVSNSAWVTWDNVYGPGANVLYKKSTDLVWTSLSAMNNWAEFGNLTPGATYQVKVRIRCLEEELANASINTRYQEMTFTTPASTCRSLAIAPGDVTASLVKTTTATVAWKALTGVTKYRVLIYGPNGLLADQQVTGLSLALTNLQVNSYYSVNVRGICTDGEGIWWSHTSFVTAGSTVCYPPNYYSQVLVTTTTAKISLYQRGGVANYKIEYKRPDETIWTSKTITPTSNSFDLTGLLDNTYYDFKIRSVCGTVDGPYYTSGNFTTVALPCKAPTLLSSVLNTTTSSATTIKWTGVVGITRYAVQYRKLTEAWPTTATEVFVTPTTNVYQYQLTGLAEFTDYEIRVKTLCNNVDESDYTAVLKVKTNVFCRVPSYSISNVTLSSFKVNITAVTGAIGYEVSYRKYDPNSPNAVWTAKNPTGTILFSDIIGLLPGTKYEVRVRTKCSTTNFSDYSITTVVTSPCSNVSSYTLTDLKNTSVRVNWPAIPGVLGYEIEYRKAGLTPVAVYTKKTATATATFVDITGLVASTLYDIRIRVKCTATGFSDYLGGQFKTLCAPPAAAPTVSFIGPKSAYVKWNAVVGVNYYKLQWKKTAAAATEWRESGLLYRDIYLTDLLEPATSYQVRVVSVCDNVNGVFSAPSSAYTFSTTALTCNETTEPNNTALTAKVITTTTPLRAKISTSTDEDWFKITATAFTAIYLSDLPANYDLYLYNSTGTEIASQSTNTGTYRDIVYTSAGTYLIKVKSAAGAFDASNCYNLAAVVPIPSVGTTQSSTVFDSDDIIQQPKLSSDFGLNGIDQLTAAPNPTSGMLQLYIKSAESGVGQLIISDYTGRIVVNMKDLSLDEGEQMKEVDLSKFSNGIYLIRLIKGENILTSKIQLIKN